MSSVYLDSSESGFNAQHDEYNEHGWMLYMKAFKRANPKSSLQRNSFSFLMLHPHEMIDVH